MEQAEDLHFQRERDELMATLQKDPTNVTVTLRLGNLLTERSKALEDELRNVEPSNEERKQQLLWDVSLLRMQANELYSRATESDPMAAQNMAVPSCTWGIPPHPSLSFRNIDDGEERLSDRMEEESDGEEESSEEEHNEAQERHMFDLARNQYESMLAAPQGMEGRMMVRYAQMLVGRMQEAGKEYRVEERDAFLSKAESLLKGACHLDPSLDTQADLDQIYSLKHNKRTKKD